VKLCLQDQRRNQADVAHIWPVISPFATFPASCKRASVKQFGLWEIGGVPVALIPPGHVLADVQSHLQYQLLDVKTSMCQSRAWWLSQIGRCGGPIILVKTRSPYSSSRTPSHLIANFGTTTPWLQEFVTLVDVFGKLCI
jgi:hypothetical protein